MAQRVIPGGSSWLTILSSTIFQLENGRNCRRQARRLPSALRTPPCKSKICSSLSLVVLRLAALASRLMSSFCLTCALMKTPRIGLLSLCRVLRRGSAMGTRWCTSNPTWSSLEAILEQCQPMTCGFWIYRRHPTRGRNLMAILRLAIRLPLGCTTQLLCARLGLLAVWWSFLEEERQTRARSTTAGDLESIGTVDGTGCRPLINLHLNSPFADTSIIFSSWDLLWLWWEGELTRMISYPPRLRCMILRPRSGTELILLIGTVIR